MLVSTVGGASHRTERPSATFLQSVGCLWLAVGLTVTVQAYGASPFFALMCSGPVWLAWMYITIPASVMVRRECMLRRPQDPNRLKTYSTSRNSPFLYLFSLF